MSTWQAPSTSRPVHATVMVPGSKSLTNRALVLATLATRDGTSTISGALRSRDTDLMIGAVQSLGITVDGMDTELTVSGAVDPRPGTRIDCGLAGTVLRFVPPVAALSSQSVTFDGDEQARVRPVAPLLEALRGLEQADEHLAERNLAQRLVGDRLADRAHGGFELVDTHVNDPAFADLVAERYLALASAPAAG